MRLRPTAFGCLNKVRYTIAKSFVEFPCLAHGCFYVVISSPCFNWRVLRIVRTVCVTWESCGGLTVGECVSWD